ncbi:MAG: hypothetical protein JWQ10_1780 [Herbaspirillum sp.]|nr:hypothetical protein [Herbaspirillum sp.]
MRVNISVTALGTKYPSDAAAGSGKQGTVQPSLKAHLRGVSNAQAVARDPWDEAKYTASELRATMQKMAKKIPLGKVQIALEEIKAGQDHGFHAQPAVWNMRSRAGAMVAGLAAATGISHLFSGVVGSADVLGLSRRPREAGSPIETQPDAVTVLSSVAPTSSTQTAPPANETIAPPMPDWMEVIDFRAFNEADFARACGVQLDHDTLSDRLHGMWKCFSPQPESNKLPLDITQFDMEKVERFYDSVMASTGYAYKTGSPTDPAFLQYLFERWFRAFTALQAGSDIHTAPFQKNLLAWTHPDASHRNQCSDGMDIDPLLPRIGNLKKKLRASYLKPYQQFGARSYLESNHQSGVEAAHGWAFEAWCQLSEPTLVRSDLPDAFRYGSLAWVQLSIGIALAGDDHPTLTLHELIAMATLSDVFAGDPDDADLLAIRRTATQAVLRMAHAHGKLNLSALSEIKQEHLDIAFDFYRSQWSLEATKLPPLEELAARLPTRLDTAKRMLAERGMRDHTRRFHAFNQYLPNQGKVYAPNTPHKQSCIPPGGRYTLPEIFMMDCLEQMRWPSSPLLEREKDLLDVPMFTHAKLEQRFQQDFDTAWPQLARAILVPALQDQIEFMGDSDKRFWCGDASLRIPTALIETRFAGGRQHKGGTGVGAQATEWVRYTAKDALLVELVLGKETLNYSITLNPLEIKPYKNSAEELLKENMHRFFKPGDGDELLGMSNRRAPTYEEHKPGGVHGNLLETISMLLLRDRGEALRASAHQTTEPEKYRAQLRETLLDLFLPLYACVRTLRAGENYAATFHCTFDMGSLFPPAKAGGKIFSMAAGLTKKQITNLGKALLLGSVEKGGRKTIEMVLKGGPLAVNFAKAGFGAIDPGFGLGKLAFRFGKRGARLLAQKWRGYDELSRVRKIVEEGSRQADKFYPKSGYWHAQDNAIMQSGERYLDDGGKRYGVFDWGQNKNLLTMQAGDNLRLVNPQSGKGYGPLMRRSGASGRLELTPRIDAAVKEGARVPDAPSHAAALCRSKRAGGSASGCEVVKDARFGAFVGYARKNLPPQPMYQFRLTDAEVAPSQFDVLAGHADAAEAAKRLRLVDAADHGYARYVQRADGVVSGEIPAELDMPAIFPATIEGRIEHLSQPGSATGADYVVFSNSHLADDGVQRERIKYHIPFGTYEERTVKISGGVETIERRIIGIAAINPLTIYRFSIDPKRIPLTAQDRPVALTRASVDEMERFENYQRLMQIDPSVHDPALVNAIRLYDAEPRLAVQVDRMMSRAETVKKNALAALTTHRADAIRIGAKLLGCPVAQAQDPDSKLSRLLRAEEKFLEKSLSLTSYMKEQSPYIIGFFKGDPAGTGTAISEASSYRNSIGDDRLDLRYLNNPVMFFEQGYLLNKGIAFENHVADWVHEETHMLKDTVDEMAPGGVPIYAARRGNRVTLTTLTQAAGLPDSEPEKNAGMLENFTMLLADLMGEGGKARMEQFLQRSWGVYTRPTLPEDLDDIVMRPDQGPAVAPPADLTPSCRSKRAGDALCHVPLLPAPRFGDRSYAQGNPPLLMKSQLVVNEEGETVLQIVNLRDVGFEEWLLNADQRWTPMAPAVSAQPDPATGAWKGIDAAVLLPDQLTGEVMVITDQYGKAASYLRVEFFSGNAQDDRMMHIRYLPFASYQDADGTLMHQVVIAGRRYSFRMNREPGAMASGGDVTLYPATAEEMRKLEKYQELLETPRYAPGIDLANAVRLRNQSGAFRREFETVMASAETKLIDAIAVFEDRSGLVSTICEKFTGGDKAAAALLSAKLGTLMRRMLASLPDFSDQSEHAIGFFTNPGGLEFNRVSGLAVRNSMAYPLDFRHMKEAVIFLNSRHFDPTIPLERRIANLLHEWTHALAGTWDSMTGEGGAPLYVPHHLGRYDLAPLIEAARLPGSVPAQHAPTVEHFIMMLANFRYASTRHLSESIVRRTFYSTSYKEVILPA